MICEVMILDPTTYNLTNSQKHPKPSIFNLESTRYLYLSHIHNHLDHITKSNYPRCSTAVFFT